MDIPIRGKLKSFSYQTYLGLAWVCGVVTFGMVSTFYVAMAMIIIVAMVMIATMMTMILMFDDQVIVRDSMECRIGRQYLCQVKITCISYIVCNM